MNFLSRLDILDVKQSLESFPRDKIQNPYDFIRYYLDQQKFLDILDVKESLQSFPRDKIQNTYDFIRYYLDQQKFLNDDKSGTNHQKLREIVRFLFSKIHDDPHFEYKNHLGVNGIIKLHFEMCRYAVSNNDCENNKLLVIGEFPEELSSYKHAVARLLNNLSYNQKNSKIEQSSNNECSKKYVRCITGDIGLHIGIFDDKDNCEETKRAVLKIRCHKCHQNTELIEKRWHYHAVEEIQETILKKEHSRMVYLCSKYEHAMLPRCKPNAFLFNLQKNI